MFGMNPAQIESQAKIFIAFFGGVATMLGWTWFDPIANQFLATIQPVLSALGPISILATAVWGLISNRQAALLLKAKAIPDVAKIDLKPTVNGAMLERATASEPNIAVAR